MSAERKDHLALVAAVEARADASADVDPVDVDLEGVGIADEQEVDGARGGWEGDAFSDPAGVAGGGRPGEDEVFGEVDDGPGGVVEGGRGEGGVVASVDAPGVVFGDEGAGWVLGVCCQGGEESAEEERRFAQSSSALRFQKAWACQVSSVARGLRGRAQVRTRVRTEMSSVWGPGQPKVVATPAISLAEWVQMAWVRSKSKSSRVCGQVGWGTPSVSRVAVFCWLGKAEDGAGSGARRASKHRCALALGGRHFVLFWTASPCVG